MPRHLPRESGPLRVASGVLGLRQAETARFCRTSRRARRPKLAACLVAERSVDARFYGDNCWLLFFYRRDHWSIVPGERRADRTNEFPPAMLNVPRFPVKRRTRPTKDLLRAIVREVLSIAEAFDLEAPNSGL